MNKQIFLFTYVQNRIDTHPLWDRPLKNNRKFDRCFITDTCILFYYFALNFTFSQISQIQDHTFHRSEPNPYLHCFSALKFLQCVFNRDFLFSFHFSNLFLKKKGEFKKTKKHQVRYFACSFHQFPIKPFYQIFKVTIFLRIGLAN